MIEVLVWMVIICLALSYPSWILYQKLYYKSKNFLYMKNKIKEHTNKCNELNAHIEELKNTYLGISQHDFANFTYSDNSIYNYKRPEYKKIKYAPNIHNCSRTVCDNARKQPFKYICKYFYIKANEETLEKFEKVLNNFEAAESGKNNLLKEKEQMMNNIHYFFPWLIRTFSKRLEQELGYKPIDLNTIYFPTFIFNYISSGGYASTQCKIVLDIENLNNFILYLSDTVKFRKSIEGQRALMTSALRKNVLQRDNFTCQKCGNSIFKEKNLLLEIDHIIPLSKGGITNMKNLQTLCWCCNRKKGAKVLNNFCIFCGSNSIDVNNYCNSCGIKQP